MDFRTVLSQFHTLLDNHITCLSEQTKPANLFVSQDGSRIYSSPILEIPAVLDETILRVYFSKLSEALKKYSYHTQILFKASKIVDGPLSESLCKVQRILTWGRIKPKYGDPVLKLLQTPLPQLYQIIKTQENQWHEMGSVLSWDQFLLICKQLDKEKSFCCAAYIALSFKNPSLSTLHKFKSFLDEFGMIKRASELIYGLAYRTSAMIQTPHEEAAFKEICMKLIPIESTFFPANYTFAADFKSEILYCSVENGCPSKFQIFSPIFSPSHFLDPAKYLSISIAKTVNWPSLNQKAFKQLYQRNYPQEALNFTGFPEHIRKDGIRLIRKAQQEGLLSKASKLSDFTRIDLMVLYFLYHSSGLQPKDRYFVSHGADFTLEKENPLEELGNAVRAYIEYDFPYLYFHFERAMENGAICYWEKKEGSTPQLKKKEIVDPLTFLMRDLRISVHWVDTLFFMEKVQELLK